MVQCDRAYAAPITVYMCIDIVLSVFAICACLPRVVALGLSTIMLERIVHAIEWFWQKKTSCYVPVFSYYVWLFLASLDELKIMQKRTFVVVSQT